LLAALITLSFIAEMSTEDRVPVMLMVDNQAAIGVLKKLYSKVPILRKLLLSALPSFATVLHVVDQELHAMKPPCYPLLYGVTSANTLTKITSVTNFYKRCLPDGVPPFPLKLEYVIGFVFVMTKTGSYKASTISQYVSCLKSANRSLLCNIFNSSEEAILSDALKAAHKKLPDGGENQKRPLTVYEITSLAALEAVEGIQASDLEALTAATLIGIYGVMRS
ncbi:hypothetical protein FOL46_003440, partial [Perkinsus olseni]